MRRISESATSLTLLGRLRDAPNDPESWSQFVQRYGRVIEQWLRGWGLQEADAQDVKQNVLLALSKQSAGRSLDSRKAITLQSHTELEGAASPVCRV